MATEETTELELEEGTEEVEENEDQDDSAGAEGAAESPELAAAREDANEAARALREAEKKDRHERRVKTYRELPEDQREGFLGTSFNNDDDREAFVDEIASLERGERVEELLASDDEALLAGYREADELLQSELEEALAEDPDRLRMLLSRRSENIVSLPEPAEGEGEPARFDGAEYWAQSAMSELVEDLEVFAAEAIADVKTGKIQVDAKIRGQLEELMAEADKFPAGHSFRERALTEAAGLAQFAREEYEASIPFGLGGVRSTKEYMAPDGWHQLEIDGRGKTRDTVIENPVFASEAGLIDEQIEPSGEDFDPESIKTLEDARGLSPDNWARIDPEKREQLLRQASAAIEEQALATRRGSM
jgi:hypothetical protein